jgi:adenylate cyclase
LRRFLTAGTLKPIRFGVWASMAAALGLFLMPSSLLQAPRELYFDVLTQWSPRPDGKVSDEAIVVADIDRAALAALEGKPWTRAQTAAVASAIAALHPAAVAFDLVFSANCDPTSPANAELAEAIGAVPTAVGFLVSEGASSGAGPSLPLLSSANANVPASWFVDGVETACPDFLQRAKASAGSFLIGDGDAHVRRVQAYSIVGSGAYPALAIAAVQLGRFRATPPIIEDHPPALRLGSGRYDLSDEGSLRFVASNAMEQAARTISAADVLSGRVPAGRVAGHIVLVGSSLPSFGGLRPTAAMPLAPSVQIHADLARGLLAGWVPQRPAWIPRYEALYVLLAGILLSAGAGYLRPIFLAFTGLGIILLTSVLAVMSFAATGLLLDGLTASVAIAVILAVVTYLQFSRVRQAERRARVRFGQYLPKSVVDRYLAMPEENRISGEAREVTALFTDIEGFSALAKRIDGRTLVGLLDTYFSEVNGLIERRGGMIDKVVGDAVHALFNAPEDLEGHVDAAIACAIDIRILTEEMRSRPDFAVVGFGRTRIGLETGLAILGEVGLAGKLDYTAHGEAVNLAARLQEANKQHQTSILIGPAAGRLAGLPLRSIGTHDIRDYGPLDLYTVD